MSVVPYRFKLRRGTTAAWEAANPILLEAEPGLDTTLGTVKYGDGVTAWLDLPYSTISAEGIQDVVGAMIAAAGGTYDDEAGMIALPSSGGGVELVSGVVDLDGTGSPVREFYCSGAATINGVAFDAGDTVVWRRTPADEWGYILVDGWTGPSALPGVTLGSQVIDGFDVTQPFTLTGGATSVDVDWGDGSAVDTVSTSPATHTYAGAGTYSATFDPGGGGSVVGRTYVVTVNYAPSMTLGAETITYLEVSQPFTTSDADGDPVTVTVDWDDASSPEVVTSPAVHTYDSAGTYAATFTPNDGLTDGAVRTATYTVAPDPLPPVGSHATLSDAIVAYGAVGYWKLDETTGTTATDYSGNARHATYVGTPTTHYTLAGQDGFALFSSSSGMVELADDDGLNAGVNGVTVFCVTRPTTTGSARNLVRKGQYGDWQLIAHNATLQAGCKDGATWLNYAQCDGNPHGVNTWRGVAATIPYPSGGEYPTFYVSNGTAKANYSESGSAGTYVNSSEVFRIAGGFLGAVGHVAVFPVLLTSAHIDAMMTLARSEGLIV